MSDLTFTKTIFKKEKKPLPSKPALTDLQEAIYTLEPETDECILVDGPLTDTEIANIVAPVRNALKRKYGIWSDKAHRHKRNRNKGYLWQKYYPKYTVNRVSGRSGFNGQNSFYEEIRFYVRYTKPYRTALKDNITIEEYNLHEPNI